MKKRFCKILSIFLAIILVTGALMTAPLTVSAEDEKEPFFATGTCGSPTEASIEWYLFDDGSVAFFGTGDMKNYSAPVAGSPASPWYLSNPVEAMTGNKIAIEDGITSVGNYAFYLPVSYSYFAQTSNIDLPNSLTKIGVSAFENMNKIQKIAIPKNVTSIGDNAFKGCTSIANIDLYCDPSALTWNASYFTRSVTCHILPEYEAQIPSLNARFSNDKLIFEANLHPELGLTDDGITRNIKGYFGTESTAIFGGAAPYVVVGTFSGMKKSVTHGSNGFASCVYYNDKYYLQESNQSGNLKEAKCNAITGVVTGMETTVLSDLNLKITSEYIGSNVVKMVYHLENKTSNTLTGIKLGGTGDIKIGADDYAAIEPLTETVNGESKQTGFYMISTKDYDKDDNDTDDESDDNYATLGFVGKNVSGSSSDATFFYGQANTNKATSATGAYRLRLIPERIFTPNDGWQSKNENDQYIYNSDYKSHSSGSYGNGVKDTGMSFYWDDISLNSNESKQFAVLFSIYGASSVDNAAGTLIEDKEESNFYNVYWKNWDDTTLVTQVVKIGETPVYPGETPTRDRDSVSPAGYVFDHWNTTATENLEFKGTTYSCPTVYHAVYTKKKLFTGHSLTLKGDIGVNFYVDVTEAQVDSGVKIRFNWSGAYNTQTDYTLTAADYDADSGCYKAQCKVCAAEMTDNIHATAFFNNVEYTGEYDDYSVRQYALEIITPTEGGPIAQLRSSNPTKYGNLVNLVKAMLNYGTKAQILFDHNNSAANHADKDITYGELLTGTVDGDVIDEAIGAANGGTTASDMSANNNAFGLKYYGSSVVYLSETSLRHYYTITNQDDYDTYKESASFQYNEDKLPFVYFEMQDIHAKDLDTLQVFTIGEQSYSYSALDYVKKLIDPSRSTAEQDLGKATYWYNRYANLYFD